MYGLADISLFESVTNCRCAVFNDTFTDVVESTDPLASHEKRVEKLIEDNPIEESGKETISNIMDKVEEQANDDGAKAAARSLYAALGSLKKVEAYAKNLSENMEDENKAKEARAFVAKYSDKLASVCDRAQRAMGYFWKVRQPKSRTIIILKHGGNLDGLDGFKNTFDSFGASMSDEFNQLQDRMKDLFFA